MKNFTKAILIIILVLVAACTIKLDVQAEKIWNTTGEKTPTGRNFTYKYWNGSSWAYCGDGSPYPELIDISYNVTYDYAEAYKMIEYVNEVRRKAGVPELIMKDELMDVAMQRAAECMIFTGHIRPDGSNIGSLSYYIKGENIYVGSGKAEVANARLANSEGHYETMIDPSYKYAGFGCVNGFWVQIFCIEELYHEDGFDLHNPSNNRPVEWDKLTCYNRRNKTEKFTAKVNPKLYHRMSCSITAEGSGRDEYFVGGYINIKAYIYHTYRNREFMKDIEESEYDIAINDNKLKLTDKGIQCVGVGTASITITLKDYPQLKVTKEIDIKVKKGSVIEKSGSKYKVTNNSKKTVSYVKAPNEKVVTIPKIVRIGKKTYKVTKIADKAFKGLNKVENVTISANISHIGKEAFAGCGKLKKITVKSTKLKSVGKNAFKGIKKNATIKVPKSKLKKYKTLFKGKGQSKKVKIKK